MKEKIKQLLKILAKIKKKLFEKNETDPFHDWVIQPSNRRINLIDSINLIPNFNETIQLDLI